MMKADLKIGDLIDVPQVRTVIRLDESQRNPRGIASSFVFTDQVAAHFSSLVASLGHDHGQGFFISGDFGSGKSHFLAALSTWLAGGEGADILTRGHRGLADMAKDHAPLLPVDISLVSYRASTSLEQIVVLAVDAALTARGFEQTVTPLSVFLGQLTEWLADPLLAGNFARLAGCGEQEIEDWTHSHPREAFRAGLRLVRENGVDAGDILFGERYQTFQRVDDVIRAAGYRGFFLILDELSEFFRAKPTAPLLNEDARTLQLLGELSQTRPFWIIAALQESIEKTGDIARATLRKIKDRFPVKLSLSTLHIRSLIAGRLIRRKPGADDVIKQVFDEYKLRFNSFSTGFAEFCGLYPVHPETIRLLDGLGDLFSQHRGIVDYVYCQVAGNAERGIPGILERGVLELLGPDSLYDHFEERLKQFSAFNQFPLRILPHFRDLCGKLFPHAQDEVLAMRLLKILIMYTLHPTASPPPAARLTELVALALPGDDNRLNVLFVTEGILDKLAEESPFLAREAAREPGGIVYRIASGGDDTRLMEAHLKRFLEEIPDDDTRVISTVLEELSPSPSWPGGGILGEGITRSISWMSSPRRVFVQWLSAEGPRQLAAISYRAGEGEFDLAVVLLPPGCPHEEVPFVACYCLDPGEEDIKLFKTYLALRQLSASLRTSHPVEARIVDMVREKLKHRQREVLPRALDVLFGGKFVAPVIEINRAVRQIRNFDRLLELAAGVHLPGRYPRYKMIMPRRVEPDLLKYRLLLDRFVIPGSLSLQEARGGRLNDLVEGLAQPLGLVEQKGKGYTFFPDISRHPFLVYFFSHLKATAGTGVEMLFEKLRLGEYGVFEDMFYFLLAALGHSGLVTLRKGNRTLPLELLNLKTVRTVTEVAPGELLSPGDRQWLMAHCSFLLPAGGDESFGLRTQREIWSNALRLKETFSRTLAVVEKGLARYGTYSALAGLQREEVESVIRGIRHGLEEIKVSFSPREGLQRLLKAFRGEGLKEKNFEMVRNLAKFFSGTMEKYNFFYHYLNHREVELACAEDEMLRSLRERLAGYFVSPLEVADSGQSRQLDEAFAAFREQYSSLYISRHAAYYKAKGKPVLDKDAEKGYRLLKRLRAVNSLDRPPGLTTFLDEREAPRPVCRFRVEEELARSPSCGCRFSLETALPVTETLTTVAEKIEGFLWEYTRILRQPVVGEAVASRAFALRDSSPEEARLLQSLVDSFRNKQVTPALLVGLLDEKETGHLARALQGTIPQESRDLGKLMTLLAGRRLTPMQIKREVDNWLACRDAETLIAIEGGAGSPEGKESAPPGWWLYLHPALAASLSAYASAGEADVAPLSRELETWYPAGELKEVFYGLEPEALLEFILREAFHFEALHQALLVLTEQILAGKGSAFPLGEGVPAYPEPRGNQLIREFLHTLSTLFSLRSAGFPELLACRLGYEKLYFHSLVTRELQGLLLAELRKVEQRGDEWLAGLPSLPVLALEEKPLVLILDGVPGDVWLSLFPPGTWGGPGLRGDWYALSSRPDTPSALAGLFGWEGEPLELFFQKRAVYRSLAGNEDLNFRSYLEGFPGDQALIIRLSMIDRQAHGGLVRLGELGALLSRILETKLLAALGFCRETGRPFYLTADHGLSFTGQEYTHGRGGVFEQAIPLFCLVKEEQAYL